MHREPIKRQFEHRCPGSLRPAVLALSLTHAAFADLNRKHHLIQPGALSIQRIHDARLRIQPGG